MSFCLQILYCLQSIICQIYALAQCMNIFSSRICTTETHLKLDCRSKKLCDYIYILLSFNTSRPSGPLSKFQQEEIHHLCVCVLLILSWKLLILNLYKCFFFYFSFILKIIANKIFKMFKAQLCRLSNDPPKPSPTSEAKLSR